MPLPPPQARKLLHTRTVTFRGYYRDDGLFEIEADLTDVKTHGLKLPDQSALLPGLPIHDLSIRVALDDDMTVREISTSMASTPFPECQKAVDPLQKMVGCTMGPGWRKAIETNLGDIKSCTHLRELLYNMATAAYQTIPSYRKHQRQVAGEPLLEDSDQPPYHLGKCMAWDFNSPVVKRYEPKFFGWQPLTRAEPPR